MKPKHLLSSPLIMLSEPVTTDRDRVADLPDHGGKSPVAGGLPALTDMPVDIAVFGGPTGHRHDVTAHFAAHGYPAPHPLTAYFGRYEEVGASITTADDVLMPVVIRKQTREIVDGVIRCERLCKEGVPWSEVPKRFVDLPTDQDVAECIATLQLDRRHESKSQMALQAALLGLAEPRQGARSDLGKNCRKLLTVSPKYLQHARAVIDPRRGAPELACAVLNGEIKIAEAAKIAEILSIEQQVAIYRKTRSGKLSFKTAAVNEINSERNRRLRQECARFPDLVVPVVYLDPPWPFDGTPLNPRDIVAHYPLLPLEKICNLAIRNLLARNAWLFMWTTVQHRQYAISQVLPAYGCKFVDEIIWEKNVRGLGRVVGHKHEILLVARKGNPPLPPTDRIPDSVVRAAVGRHSEKPDIIRDIIIGMTPNLEPRLELFARGAPYPGFIAWGNEVTPPRDVGEASRPPVGEKFGKRPPEQIAA